MWRIKVWKKPIFGLIVAHLTLTDIFNSSLTKIFDYWSDCLAQGALLIFFQTWNNWFEKIFQNFPAIYNLWFFYKIMVVKKGFLKIYRNNILRIVDFHKKIFSKTCRTKLVNFEDFQWPSNRKSWIFKQIIIIFNRIYEDFFSRPFNGRQWVKNIFSMTSWPNIVNVKRHFSRPPLLE